MLSLLVAFLPSIGLLCLKLLAVVGLARKIAVVAPDLPGRWLAAWVGIHVTLVAAMLALSAFGALTRLSMWLLFGGLALALYRPRFRISPRGRPSAGSVLFGLVFLIMLLRASFAQEYTQDAQTYGLVRLAVWMNYRSVLVHMPTEQVNIFTNEWNGELIALSYGLAGRSIQGFMLGNVEVLLVLFLAARFLSQQLGSDRRWASAVALLVATTPAVMGLTASTKGDSLAVAAAMMAAGWLASMLSRPQGLTVTLVCAAAALATSSKVAAAPLGVLLALAAVVIGCSSLRWRAMAQAIGAAMLLSVVLCSRFVLNWSVYGTPLKRTANEVVEPTWHAFYGALMNVGRLLFSFIPELPGLGGTSLMLAAGLGVAGFATLALLVYQGAARVPFGPDRRLLAAAAVASVLAIAAVAPNAVWAFRYFLPAIALLMVCMLSFPTVSSRATLWGQLVLIGCSVANLTYLARPGEIHANRYFGEYFALSMKQSTLERTLLHYPPLLEQYGIDALRIDDRGGQRIAVHAFLNTPTGSLVGSRAQNRLVYFDSEASLLQALDRSCFDLVALTKERPAPIAQSLVSALASRRFSIATDGDLIAIARAEVTCPLGAE